MAELSRQISVLVSERTDARIRALDERSGGGRRSAVVREALEAGLTALEDALSGGGRLVPTAPGVRVDATKSDS